LDLERVRENVKQATTEDLLDRATVYRDGMERAALEIIDRELSERGVTLEALRQHERNRGAALVDVTGMARKCSRCQRPAVMETVAWHYLWGLVPLFLRRFAYCEEHRPIVYVSRET
jgi:hypothetical protein